MGGAFQLSAEGGGIVLHLGLALFLTLFAFCFLMVEGVCLSSDLGMRYWMNILVPIFALGLNLCSMEAFLTLVK